MNNVIPIDAPKRAQELVRKIQAGDYEAEATLYDECKSFVEGDNLDIVHELWLDMVEKIRDGAIDKPERLWGYIRRAADRITQRHMNRREIPHIFAAAA